MPKHIREDVDFLLSYPTRKKKLHQLLHKPTFFARETKVKNVLMTKHSLVLFIISVLILYLPIREFIYPWFTNWNESLFNMDNVDRSGIIAFLYTYFLEVIGGLVQLLLIFLLRDFILPVGGTLLVFTFGVFLFTRGVAGILRRQRTIIITKKLNELDDEFKRITSIPPQYKRRTDVLEGFRKRIQTNPKQTFSAYVKEQKAKSGRKANRKKEGRNDREVTRQQSEELTNRHAVLKEANQQLAEMVGLDEFKEMMREFELEMVGREKTLHLRGENVPQAPLHMALIGNPGTGKTVLARIITKLLYGYGQIAENKCIEIDRSSIIGAHIGETEERMKTTLDEAMGGVLFIDEAHSLMLEEESNDFAPEAISVLMKSMEDERTNLVVILAGYPVDLERMIESHKGLRSRLVYLLHLEDYNESELAEMARRMFAEQGFTIANDNVNVITQQIQAKMKNQMLQGNGRTIRSLVERTIRAHHVRIAAEKEGQPGLITSEDIQDGITAVELEQSAEKKLRLKEEATAALHQLIGLTSLKKELLKILKYAEMNVRKQQLLATRNNEPIALHMMFHGAPGTGKTTVARIIGKYLAGAGILAKGHVVEVDRSHLVGKHIGHSESITRQKIEEARGGILFIDEAYALHVDDQNDFGSSVVNTLVKAMEDMRSEVVVIFAGYSNEMNEMMKMNTGLQSRIAYTFDFPVFSQAELQAITKQMLQEKGSICSAAAQFAFSNYLNEEFRKRGSISGNGRWVRNFVEKLLIEQHYRISQLNEVTSEHFKVIPVEDVHATWKTMKKVAS